MAAKVYAKVKGAVLRWARESAGLSIESAASKTKLRAEQIRDWEDTDDNKPTISQLRRLGKAYKRPIAVFYLPRPPSGFAPMHDYRRLPGDESVSPQSPELLYEVRRAIERREAALELLTELGEEPPEFKLRIRLSENVDQAGAKIRSFLGVSLDDQFSWRRGPESFEGWRSAIEDAGALVVQLTDVPLKESRGFSIAMDPLPVIAANWSDGHGGRIFTLFHELAHVALRRGGLCNYDDHSRRAPEDLKVEVYCNQVAGAALVPSDSLLSESKVVETSKKTGWGDDDIFALANRYGVSQEVIVRRLLTLGRTTKNFYESKRDQFRRDFEESKKEQLRKAKQRGASRGPHPADKAVSCAGRAFTRLVLSSYSQDRITLSDLSNLLEVRVKHLDGLRERAARGRVSS